MNNIFKPQINTQPTAYFAPLVCSHMDALREVADQFCAHVTADCSRFSSNKANDNRLQIMETDEWDAFFCAIEELEWWVDVSPANRPYDFGWCKAHLALWETTKTIGALALRPHQEDIHVGAVAITSSSLKNDGPEIIYQFRELASLADKIENTLQHTMPGRKLPSVATFQP